MYHFKSILLGVTVKHYNFVFEYDHHFVHKAERPQEFGMASLFAFSHIGIVFVQFLMNDIESG